MVTQEMLDAEKAQVETIEITGDYKPNRSIADFLQEAGDLIPVTTRDEVELKAVNLDWTYVERLEPAIEVLRDAESRWRDEKNEATEAREQWNTDYPEALKLKNDILATMGFVYYNNPDKLNRIAEIREGDDQRDTIQDLHDLAYLGKQDIPAFEAINYELAKFDQAEAYSNSLMLLLGTMNGDHSSNEDKLLRDKAFFNLTGLVQTIQRYGKYVFRNNAERIKDYYRKYN